MRGEGEREKRENMALEVVKKKKGGRSIFWRERCPPKEEITSPRNKEGPTS